MIAALAVSAVSVNDDFSCVPVDGTATLNTMAEVDVVEIAIDMGLEASVTWLRMISINQIDAVIGGAEGVGGSIVGCD